jgi:amino acid transporter
MTQSASPPREGPASLGLWDTVSLIIGIVVGTTIYEAPPYILQNLPGPWTALAIWALCGLLSLIGALCYAELATTYPRRGGDYVYLGRAYGSWMGFLFGWAQIAVILTGSIGMMAYVFADYARKLWGLGPEWGWVCAGMAVLSLTLLNLFGVVFGKGTQNLLTAAKVLGLGGIVAAGLFWPVAATPFPAPSAEFTLDFAAAKGLFEQPSELGSAAWHFLRASPIAFAMVLVLLAYGGWNDAAYVAAEQRDGRRNIPRALILGTAGITLVYLLVNVAYLRSLGFDGVRRSQAVAADVLAGPLQTFGEKAMCVLVMVSALGAINGLIFAGSRVYSIMGADHAVFAWLGRGHRGRGVPPAALLTEAAISLGLIVLVGTEAGRSAVESLFARAGLETGSWAGRGGFELLLKCTAPVFWLFFLLTGLALFVLRVKDRHLERPFRVPLFPLLPLLFCATCTYMLYGAVRYADRLGLVGGVLLLAGLPLYGLSLWLARVAAPRPEGPADVHAPPAFKAPAEGPA